MEIRNSKFANRNSKLGIRTSEVRNEPSQKVLALSLEKLEERLVLDSRLWTSRLSTVLEKQTAPGRLDDPSAVPKFWVGEWLPGS
jgi:hypothetical protein